MPVALFEIAVTGHRPKWKIFRVAVIAQEKDPGEACRGETFFLPKSILRLGTCEIANPRIHRFVLDHAGGHQCKQCPCRLRWRTRRRTIACIIQRITLSPFAPPAIIVLDGFQPGNGFLYIGALRIALEYIECTQYRPSSINIIHSPPAEPAAIFLLDGEEIINATRNHGIGRRPLAELAEKREAAGCDIRSRRIE